MPVVCTRDSTQGGWRRLRLQCPTLSNVPGLHTKAHHTTAGQWEARKAMAATII